MCGAGGLEWQLDPCEIPGSHLERLTQTAGAAPCPTDGVQDVGENKNLPTAGEFQLTFSPQVFQREMKISQSFPSTR